MLSDIVGKKKFKLDFEGTNLQGILDELIHRYGTEVNEILYDRKGAFNPEVQIVLNHEDWIPAYRHNMTSLHEGDTLCLVILLPGG
jgi:hypothetical protein